jgi:tyrosine-protein kinase Etk/Wzc
MTENNNLLPLLKVWAKWRKAILFICIATGVGAAIVTLFLADYYQSTTIFYPAHSDLQKPDKLFGYGSESMYYYGVSEDVDRVISVAESEELKDFLIQRFHLYEHYNVDSTTSKGRNFVREILASQFKVQKNRLDAIELISEDFDPQIAKEMAKIGRQKIDEMAQNMVKRSQMQIVKTFEQNLADQKIYLNKLEDSLRRIRGNYGIYNTETQSKILTDLSAIAEARLARTSAQVAALEREPNANRDTIIMLKSLAKGLQNEVVSIKKGNGGTNSFNQGVGEIDVLTQVHLQARKQIGFDVVRLEQLKAALKSDVSALYVVEEARLADIKSRPKRMIIVAAAIFAAFIFATIGILLFENYKSIDWKALREE